MKRVILAPKTSINELGNGVWAIDESLIYQSPKSAKHWVNLTKSKDYIYYNEELSLIKELISSNNVSELKHCSFGVFIGAADAEKEALLTKEVTSAHKSFKVVLIDQSPFLLELAFKRLVDEAEASALKVLCDVLDEPEVKKTLPESLYIKGLSPKFLTSFGNTIGNYEDLNILRSLVAIMNSGDLIIFGVHTKSELGKNEEYPAYSSHCYNEHMYSVLQDAGINPNIGKLSTRVQHFHNGSVDKVEIIFSISCKYSLHTTKSGLKVSSLSKKITEIVVDSSCKYSKKFLIEKIKELALQPLHICSSESGGVSVFLCRKH